jgi:hypothetical protein
VVKQRLIDSANVCLPQFGQQRFECALHLAPQQGFPQRRLLLLQ